MNRFVSTSVSKTIYQAISRARTVRCAMLIEGPAGIGKTMALEHIGATDPDAR